MNGKEQIRFSELFADTAQIMSDYELWLAYVYRGKMAQWEFEFWLAKVDPNRPANTGN